jgi:hypothetical protein
VFSYNKEKYGGTFMSVNSQSATENNQLQRFRDLKSRESMVSTNVAAMKMQLSAAEKDLKEKSARIKEECGTDQIQELVSQYRENSAENEKGLQALDAYVTDAEKIIQDIKKNLEEL